MSAFNDYCIVCEKELDSENVLKVYCSHECKVVESQWEQDRVSSNCSDYSMVLNSWDFNQYNYMKVMDRIAERNYKFWVNNH